MMYRRLSKLFLLGSIIIGLNTLSPIESWGYLTTLQEMSQQNATQLLRVTLEPSEYKNTVNVYLYTSDNYPTIKEKNNSSSDHIIELYDTSISTTNNINTGKVSDLISNVKIVPYINTSNPNSVDMARVFIKPKVPGLKYNVFVKTLKTSGASKNKITAKVYYPPKPNNNMPQSMAIFSPLEDDIIAQLPPEKANNPASVPTAPSINTSGSATSLPGETKLKVNPPQNVPMPTVQQNVQNLPEISGTPVGTQTVPPTVSQPVPPASATTTAVEDPTQGVEAPQPPPKSTQGEIETSLPKPLAFGLMIVSVLLLIITLLVVVIIFKKIRAKKKKQKLNQKTEQVAGSMPEGFEEIQPGAIDLNKSAEESTHIKTKSINGTLIDEIEEVIVLDGFAISATKNIYLVRFMDSISLVSSVNDEVVVLYNFASYEISGNALEIKVTEKYKVTGKEMIEISIGDWKAVLASENNHVTLNNVISG